MNRFLVLLLSLVLALPAQALAQGRQTPRLSLSQKPMHRPEALHHLQVNLDSRKYQSHWKRETG